MDLSIIILSYNTKDLLRKCLRSIEKQKRAFSNFEVIVVDNGSTDGSVEYLKEKKRVKKIFNTQNFGFAKANNQGIKKAKGKYILLLNSDTIIRRLSLKRLVGFAKRHGEAGVVVPKLLNKDGSVQSSCYYFSSILGAVKEFWLDKKGSFLKYAPKTEKAKTVDAAVGAAFLIPKKVIDEVGLLDEQYFIYFEDLDYCRRVKKAGYKVYYLPSSKIIHLHGQSAKKAGEKPNQWLIESSEKYHGAFKHYLINLVIWSGQRWQKLKKQF